MPDLTYPTVDYGPLLHLVGTWTGDKGMDHSPLPEGQTEDPYFETITVVDAGALTNAKEQDLVMVRYQQVVSRKSDGGVFHDQCGYWMWCEATGLIMHSLNIPRGLALVAGGHIDAGWSVDDGIVMRVRAAADDAEYGISQQPFLQEKAKTVAFEAAFTVKGDELHYEETTSLEIYDRSFAHTDVNTLTKR